MSRSSQIVETLALLDTLHHEHVDASVLEYVRAQKLTLPTFLISDYSKWPISQAAADRVFAIKRALMPTRATDGSPHHPEANSPNAVRRTPRILKDYPPDQLTAPPPIQPIPRPIPPRSRVSRQPPSTTSPSSPSSPPSPSSPFAPSPFHPSPRSRNFHSNQQSRILNNSTSSAIPPHMPSQAYRDPPTHTPAAHFVTSSRYASTPTTSGRRFPVHVGVGGQEVGERGCGRVGLVVRSGVGVDRALAAECASSSSFEEAWSEVEGSTVRPDGERGEGGGRGGGWNGWTVSSTASGPDVVQTTRTAVKLRRGARDGGGGVGGGGYAGGGRSARSAGQEIAIPPSRTPRRELAWGVGVTHSPAAPSPSVHNGNGVVRGALGVRSTVGEVCCTGEDIHDEEVDEAVSALVRAATSGAGDGALAEAVWEVDDAVHCTGPTTTHSGALQRIASVALRGGVVEGVAASIAQLGAPADRGGVVRVGFKVLTTILTQCPDLSSTEWGAVVGMAQQLLRVLPWWAATAERQSTADAREGESDGGDGDGRSTVQPSSHPSRPTRPPPSGSLRTPSYIGDMYRSVPSAPSGVSGSGDSEAMHTLRDSDRPIPVRGAVGGVRVRNLAVKLPPLATQCVRLLTTIAATANGHAHAADCEADCLAGHAVLSPTGKRNADETALRRLPSAAAVTAATSSRRMKGEGISRGGGSSAPHLLKELWCQHTVCLMGAVAVLWPTEWAVVGEIAGHVVCGGGVDASTATSLCEMGFVAVLVLCVWSEDCPSEVKQVCLAAINTLADVAGGVRDVAARLGVVAAALSACGVLVAGSESDAAHSELLDGDADVGDEEQDQCEKLRGDRGCGVCGLTPRRCVAATVSAVETQRDALIARLLRRPPQHLDGCEWFDNAEDDEEDGQAAGRGGEGLHFPDTTRTTALAWAAEGVIVRTLGLDGGVRSSALGGVGSVAKARVVESLRCSPAEDRVRELWSDMLRVWPAIPVYAGWCRIMARTLAPRWGCGDGRADTIVSDDTIATLLRCMSAGLHSVEVLEACSGAVVAAVTAAERCSLQDDGRERGGSRKSSRATHPAARDVADRITYGRLVDALVAGSVECVGDVVSGRHVDHTDPTPFIAAATASAVTAALAALCVVASASRVARQLCREDSFVTTMQSAVEALDSATSRVVYSPPPQNTLTAARVSGRVVSPRRNFVTTGDGTITRQLCDEVWAQFHHFRAAVERVDPARLQPG